MTGKRLENTVGELVKVRIKPAHFHEVAVYLPIKVDYNANTVFEVRDVGGYWLLYGKVFHKKVFGVVEEETEMSRSCITDKGSGIQPPKPASEWFGFKYKVNPEISKLLQEAVFKDGGGWGYSLGKDVRSNCTHIFITCKGEMTYISDGDDEYFIEESELPEKQPPQVKSPQPKKDFIVGKWYKNLNGAFVKAGTYYQLREIQGILLVFEGVDSRYHPEKFDVNSESDYDRSGHSPFTIQPAPDPYKHTAYVKFKGYTGQYDSKEYCYKCDDSVWDDWRVLPHGTPSYATVNVSGEIKTVQVQRVSKNYLDSKATKCIIGIVEEKTTGLCQEIPLQVHPVPCTLGLGDIQPSVSVKQAMEEVLERLEKDIESSRADLILTGFTSPRIAVVAGKDFEVGKHYKPLVDRTHLTQGKYYKVVEMNSNKNCLRVIDDNGDKTYFGRGGFHPVALEDEEIKWPVMERTYQEVWDFKKIADLDKTGNNATTNVGDVIMSTQINRKVVKVELFDNDAGLPVENSLVFYKADVVTEDSDSVTVQEIIASGEIAKLITKHNELRGKTTDLEVQKRTGQSVKLQPIKLKNLVWKVDGRIVG